MKLKYFLLPILLAFIQCNKVSTAHPKVNSISAMKNAMWKGEIGPKIYLDTIEDKKGLYGLGPLQYLKGEITIVNGKSYVSRVTSDTTMAVTKSFAISAPFFVYSNVRNWKKISLPDSITTVKDIEGFVNKNASGFKNPFAFTLKGKVKKATIHIQNLPEGTKVRSPKEAHQGQVNYNLENETVEIVGFFSREHQGIFTHHDTFIHMHLITNDKKKMGHLDSITIQSMTLYLPQYVINK